MKVNISSLKFKADKKLLNFIEERAHKLEQIHQEILGGDVILRVENTSTDANKIVEMKLLLKGEELFAEKHSSTFENATDQVVDALKKQLRKYKEKHTAK